jgi:site-specific DNA-methyltransferase (adenine-specific)
MAFRILPNASLKRFFSAALHPIEIPKSHILVCGDCTDSKSYRHLQNKKANILITDPPYCLLERKRSSGEKRDSKSEQKRNKIDDADEVPRYQNLAEYRQFTERWLKTAITHGLEKDAPLIIWSNFLGKRIIVDVCRHLQYNCVGEFVWAKLSSATTSTSSSSTSFLFNTTQSEVLARVYEIALIFQPKTLLAKHLTTITEQNNGLSLNEAILIREGVVKNRHTLPWHVISGYHDIVEGSSVVHQHPCHKPLPCLLPLIHTWTQQGDIILDPFAGSGGIGEAVIAAGDQRQYRGIEILPTWGHETQRKLEHQCKQKSSITQSEPSDPRIIS